MQPTAILVVGPPRSGTSAISHVVSALGVDFGDQSRFVDASVYKHNPIFFELKSVNELNDKVMGWLGHKYIDSDFMPLREDFDHELAKRFAPLCSGLVRSELGDGELIGLKDPRFCFVLPLWIDGLKKLGYKVRFIWVVRDLGAVVRSNEQVNAGWARERNVRIAALSALAAAYFLSNTDCLRIDYDKALEDPLQAARQLAQWIGCGADGDAIAAAAAVLDRGLRNFDPREDDVPGACAEVSSELLGGTLQGERYEGFVKLVRCIGLEPARATSDDAVLYFRRADGEFNAEDSVSAVATPGTDGSRISFEVPAKVAVDLVRFDPATQPGVFVITGLRVNGAEVTGLLGRTRRVNRYVLNGEGGSSVWLASYDDDPYIEFDLGGLTELKGALRTVEIDCRRCNLDQTMGPFAMLMLDTLRHEIQSDNAMHSSQLQTQMEALNEAKQRLQADLAASNEREAMLRQRVNMLDGAEQRLQAELVASGEREAHLNQQIGSLRERGSRIEDDLQRSRDVASAFAHQVETAQANAARLEVELARSGERVGRTLREAFWLSAKSVQAHERVTSVGRALANVKERLVAAEDSRTQLQLLNSGLQAELGEIKASTLWRVLLRCRNVLLWVPTPLRTLLRKCAKLIWWVVTPWRMPARMRFLRARRDASRREN